MKTILSFLFLIPVSVSAQLRLFNNENPQQPAEVSRAIIWDIAQTDSLNYFGDIRPVLGYTYPGKSLLILAKSNEYEEIKKRADSLGSLQFNDASVVVGFDYGVTYLPKFSLLTKKQLKNLTPTQKLTATALNDKEKYTLLGMNPRPVYGRRTIDPKTKEMVIAILLPSEVKELGQKQNTGSNPVLNVPKKQ